MNFARIGLEDPRRHQGRARAAFLLLFFWRALCGADARPSAGLGARGRAVCSSSTARWSRSRRRVDPLSAVARAGRRPREYRQRDLVRAIEAAATDDRIKAVVLDLDRFTGGGQVHLERIGAALDTVRAAKKPVLAHAAPIPTTAMLLAAHASEVWVDPLGGAVIAGPGGNRLYYKALLDRLKVKAHVFKVGTYKSAVEPYLPTSDLARGARQNLRAVYAALWELAGRCRQGAAQGAVSRWSPRIRSAGSQPRGRCGASRGQGRAGRPDR